MATIPKWSLSGLSEGIERTLGGGDGDGRLIDERAMAVMASPELGNSTKIVMGTSALPPHFATVPHFHEAEEVAVVLSGSGWVDIDGVSHPMEQGTVLFTPSGSPHQTHSGPEGLTVLWFYAPPGSEVRWLASGSGES